ncbi:hypothetical protein FQA47_009913, partial [Oryzias melastigma]
MFDSSSLFVIWTVTFTERLDLTEDCSLVLKKITAEDEGRYSCRLRKPSRPQFTVAVVYLTVIR